MVQERRHSESPSDSDEIVRDRRSGTSPATPQRPGGFQALLRDAGLWDLVQMKCESRTRCVVRVGSHGRSGYLYFTDGQIVHAILGSTYGEEAALEILSWSQGSWDPCERSWPGRNTISISWQGLLLRAVQRQDEARADKRASSVRALPRAPQVEAEATMSQAPPPLPPASRDDSGTRYRPDDFEHAVRLSPQGQMLGGHGRVEELAALAGYAARLGDLIGGLMAMGPVRAIEATVEAGSCLIFRSQSGTTVALKPRPHVDLARVRTQLRL